MKQALTNLDTVGNTNRRMIYKLVKTNTSQQMKSMFKIVMLLFVAMAFTSCSDDDDEGPQLEAVESKTASNIPAPQTGGQPSPDPIGGPFTKFSFATGAVTTDETEWDIAFRGTRIAVNGGVATGTADEPVRNGNAGAFIATGTFASVTTAEGLTFIQDADGAYAITPLSDEGWYNYNPQVNIISPIPGRVLVFRTHDGKYAKVEILSYYKDAPAQPDGFGDESRFYTFNYVYNPNAGETSLQ
ncbi:MAG: HmuY family protein [Saonia sp.]